MDVADMVHQANQIAQFFASYPAEEAIPGVADHFRKFWEPRMRKQLLAHVKAGGEGLHALVLPAADRLSNTMGES
ncbi:MAG: formate dehydrogenase subunit delta [Acidobacteriia bacterium]|nr:formate dehydrogenase subunit delta [Terriglobia bacterium]